MSWVEQVKESIPDHSKDIKLNLDSVMNRSGLDEIDAHACAFAAALAAGNGDLAFEISMNISLSTQYTLTSAVGWLYPKSQP